MQAPRARRSPPPLDAEALERIALSYAGRYATTRAKLRAYLDRKVKQRGWAEEGEPPIAALVERFASAGYVDDRAFAMSRAASLSRRGYGPRRVAVAMKVAGVEEADAEAADEAARDAAWAAALRFAERRSIGPFASERPDRDGRAKAFAAMLRAGHSSPMVKRLIEAEPGAIPEWDDA